MDLLDFDGQDLYFDEPLSEEVAELLRKAGQEYANGDARGHLMRAYFLEPEHPMVLVALYRFFYYRHSHTAALDIAERTLRIMAQRLRLPIDWTLVTSEHVDKVARRSIPLLRFYLLALSGSGYLLLRLGKTAQALERLCKVKDLDEADRLGVGVLIETIQAARAADHPPEERTHA